MPEYIERETLEKFIEKGLNNPDKEKAFGHDAIEILTELHHMPAADVAPVVHGKWKRKASLYAQTGYIYTCSACNGRLEHIGLTLNYCPNCGAKMEGEGT